MTLLSLSSILTSSILMTQVWKPPDVAQPNTESHLGQKVFYFAVPASTGRRFGGAVLALLTILDIQF